MPDYILTQTDIRDAENFLVQFQSEQIPDASFEVGSATRDILIKGFAYLYAFIRGEIDRVSARQSILRIKEELTDADDIAQAVDEILSNWFVTRKGGSGSRMTARFHFSQKRDFSVPSSSRFWRTNAAVFYIDTTTDPYVVSSNILLPVYDSKGVLIDYVVDVPMRAARTGTGYNIPPGKFVQVQVPGGLPYFSYAENTEASSGGLGAESTDALIERSNTAISVRNLINNRSCDATLQEQFPEIIGTLTIGMGEPEMIRDRRTEVAPHLELHMGGHYDTYVELPYTTVEENLIVGGFFPRPDSVVNIFRDPLLTYGTGVPGSEKPFTSLGVQTGHILYIRNGLIGAPRGFQITKVTDHELEVSEHTYFPEASDEKLPIDNTVLYSIGWFSPGFEEIEFSPGIFQNIAAQSTDPAAVNVPWGTSRHIQQPGKVVLGGRPVQDISWVEITNPDGGDPLIDPGTGTIIFHDRVNYPPSEQAEPAYTQYQIDVLNPEKAQSMEAVNLLVVGYTHTLPNPPGTPNMGIFDGKNLRVVYKTLNGFGNIHAFVVGRNERVAAANQLVRARHPVWIQANIPYRMKPTSGTSLDAAAASQNLAAHINSFNPNDDLDVSDLMTQLRLEFTDVGAVFPFRIYYSLTMPDGQIVMFSTSDIVSIFITDTNGVQIENSGDLTPPPDLIQRGITSIATKEALLDWMNYEGVSNRTVLYRTTESMITFELRE